MNLELKDKYKEDILFKFWLITKLKTLILTKFDNDKVLLIEAYINSLPRYKSIFRGSITGREIIVSGANNLIARSYPDKDVIEINPNVKLYGTNCSLLELCKLLNYGNLSMHGYSLFDDIFDDVIDHIERYYQEYLKYKRSEE